MTELGLNARRAEESSKARINNISSRTDVCIYINKK